MNIRVSAIVIIIFLSACSSLNKLSLYNLSNQYDKANFTEFYAVAFNEEEQSARVYVELYMGDMVSAHDEENNRNYRKAELKYELFETYESKQILDSASLFVIDSNFVIDDTLLALNIEYPGKGKYVLKLNLTDMNRVDDVSKYLLLDHSGPSSPEEFLLKDEDGSILFNHALNGNQLFYLELADRKATEIYVRYYKRDFPLALPPFLEESETSFNYRADSVFILEANQGKTSAIQLPDKGFYHFQTDSNLRRGYTIYRFSPTFPEINTPEQMLQPLRYITTIAEYDEIRNSDDIKLAIDNFWLNNAGNPSRARSMILKYYGRVVEANEFFTSYHEGWKTDRGLIYIVYGPPKIVYRGKNIEEWLYGEKGNNNSIRLQFVKVSNPFSENDYSLIKSPSYKEKWYNIVNTWRR